jgi:hypothetical protein
MARITVRRFSIALLLTLVLDSSRAWVPPTITHARRPSSAWRRHYPREERCGTASDIGSGRSIKRNMIDNGETRELGTGRRKFVSKILSKASAIATMIGYVGQDAASAADSGDILDQFGLDLAAPSGIQQVQRSSKWPRESPSPLPTRKKSAQELTRDPDPPAPASSSAPGAPPGADADDTGNNDMANALRDASQKKRIDPRTHG